MKIGAILYGDFGDIAAMSALSNIIKDTEIVLITSPVYKKFAERYGSFLEIIEFSTKNIDKTIKKVNTIDIDVLCDLHSSSYSNPDFIYWLNFVDINKIRITRSRANRLDKSNLSKIEQLNDRIISTKIHNVENYLNKLDINMDLKKDSLKIKPTIEDKAYSINIKKEFGNKKVIGLIPNSRFPHKEWNHKNWYELAFKLNSKNYLTAILCAKYEIGKMELLAENTSSIILSSATPEGHIKNVLSMDTLVSIDTGLKHIAGYLDYPIVTLYGHSSPEIWGTLSSSEYMIKGDLECIPCNNPFFCKFENSSCVDSISVEKVLEKIISIG